MDSKTKLTIMTRTNTTPRQQLEQRRLKQQIISRKASSSSTSYTGRGAPHSSLICLLILALNSSIGDYINNNTVQVEAAPAGLNFDCDETKFALGTCLLQNGQNNYTICQSCMYETWSAYVSFITDEENTVEDLEYTSSQVNKIDKIDVAGMKCNQYESTMCGLLVDAKCYESCGWALCSEDFNNWATCAANVEETSSNNCQLNCKSHATIALHASMSQIVVIVVGVVTMALLLTESVL